MSSARCQETITGSVCDGDTKKGVPYAAVHLLNSYIGTSCNESGSFTLHIPQGMEESKVIFTSLGYKSDTIKVRTLFKKNGKVVLSPNSIQLVEVDVVEYVSARRLMEAVFERIPQNYRTDEAVGIWQYRNRQMLNDSLFVKSDGLMRVYMPAYGNMLTIIANRDNWKEAKYRICQSLDTVLFYDTVYLRSLIGSEALSKLDIESLNGPSDGWNTISDDIVNYINKKSNHLFSKKSKFSMETFTQDGKDYYRVTITFRPRGMSVYETAIMVINKSDLAIVESVVAYPISSYLPQVYLKHNSILSDVLFYEKVHCRYYKYNGKYQQDFVQREYEQLLKFKPEATKAGCKTSYLKISGKEECILVEHTFEGVEEYKQRYWNNEHPLTEENIKETERILRQPHNKMPW